MSHQEELNCALTKHGVPCVMMAGMILMLQLSAGNLDCHLTVSHAVTLDRLF